MKHLENCMCDNCIKKRVIERKARETAQIEANSYIQRRGGEVGNISLQTALRERK